MDNLVIIHVGKCGGITVRCELKSKNIKFSEIHIREAIYKPKNNYVINDQMYKLGWISDKQHEILIN